MNLWNEFTWGVGGGLTGIHNDEGQVRPVGCTRPMRPLIPGPSPQFRVFYGLMKWTKKKKNQPLIPWYKYIFCNYAYPHMSSEKCKYRASVETARNGVNRCYKRGLQKGCLGVNTSRPLSNKRCVCVSTRTCLRSCVCVEYKDCRQSVSLLVS